MTKNHAHLLSPEPLEIAAARDPAACLRRASACLALGGLAEAAHYTRLAAEIIEKRKQKH